MQYTVGVCARLDGKKLYFLNLFSHLTFMLTSQNNKTCNLQLLPTVTLSSSSYNTWQFLHLCMVWWRCTVFQLFFLESHILFTGLEKFRTFQRTQFPWHRLKNYQFLGQLILQGGF
jgi:hypothetical protein